MLQKDKTVIQKLELDALDTLSKFTVKLTCSYCKQFNVLPIQLNKKNTFKCEGCNQVNGVAIQFSSTALTTPIQSPKMSLESSETLAEFKSTT